MAIDALKNLSANVPEWLQRLGELSGQIEQRQAELAAVGDGNKSARSVRNKGSSESLLTKDDDEPAAHSPDGIDVDPPVSQPQTDKSASPRSPSGPPATSGELRQQTKSAMAVAQARARQQVRNRHRSQSIVSIEGNPAAYRSRSMIIVYYDSYVENFFEELVKFISASRNLMRKAKMAAKVAHIKRMAELGNRDGRDDADDDADDDDPTGISARPLPSLRYLSGAQTSALSPTLARISARGGVTGQSGAADVYDQLDKGLEYVQSMCERAAHQFLRDGDCNEEISNIVRRLTETTDMAEKEAERILRDEPNLATDTAETQKFRTHRPPAVRRDASGAKDSSAGGALRDIKVGTGAPATGSAAAGPSTPANAP